MNLINIIQYFMLKTESFRASLWSLVGYTVSSRSCDGQREFGVCRVSTTAFQKIGSLSLMTIYNF